MELTYNSILQELRVRSKYARFLVNMGLSLIGGAIPGGAAAAELASEFTTNEKYISICSTVANYLGQSAVFLPLHAKSNPDLYLDEEIHQFNKKEFIHDTTKIVSCSLAWDAIYYTARSLLVFYMQKKGYEAGTASIVADFICLPAYAWGVTETARHLKVIRTNGVHKGNNALPKGASGLEQIVGSSVKGKNIHSS